MAVLTPETCWALNKEIKKASDIKLVSLYSTIKMMHGPINIKNLKLHYCFHKRVLLCKSYGRNLITYLYQTYLWEAGSYSACQKILRVLYKPSAPPRVGKVNSDLRSSSFNISHRNLIHKGCAVFPLHTEMYMYSSVPYLHHLASYAPIKSNLYLLILLTRIAMHHTYLSF